MTAQPFLVFKSSKYRIVDNPVEKTCVEGMTERLSPMFLCTDTTPGMDRTKTYKYGCIQSGIQCIV